MPDVPNTRGGGGSMRSYHFARALAQTFDSTILVCVEKGQDEDEYGGLEKVARILRPAFGFYDEPRNRRRSMSGIRRAFVTLFSPAREHGKLPMIVGQGRSCSGFDGEPVSLPHRLYRFLIWLEVSALWRYLNLYPTATLVRLEEFRALVLIVQRAHAETPFDVIWCEHSYLYPLVEELRRLMPGARTVCNAHNSERTYLGRRAHLADSWAARRWFCLESKMSRHWEARAVTSADLVITCSDVDRGHFAALDARGRARIWTVPNGVDCKYFSPVNDVESESIAVLFTGSAGYHPNDDAVTWLVNDIFPLIRNALPDCQLWVAGRNAETNWGRHRRQDRGWLHVFSDLSDMRPLLEAATVCLVPLRSGSGTRLKILEKMAMGKAIVSTSIGAEGIDVTDGKNIVIADSKEDLALSAIDLLSEPSRRQKLGVTARRLVETKYDWNNLMRETAVSVKRLFSTPDGLGVPAPRVRS
jgi:glycosyltransferase involved in cell wall biosynthesis